MDIIGYLIGIIIVGILCRKRKEPNYDAQYKQLMDDLNRRGN